MDRRLDTLQKIEIAEGVEIDLRPAGPLVRGAAFLVDNLIKIGVWIVAALFIGLFGGFAGLFGGGDLGAGVVMGLSSLVLFALEWIYFVSFEASRLGATPGKRVFKLRVAQLSGAPITFHQAVVRNLLRAVDVLPFLGATGLVSMLVTRRFQRLGDLAAETVVIYGGKVDLVNRGEDIAMNDGELLRPMVALTREEQMAILVYAERAGDWSGPRREELAQCAGAILTGATGPDKVNQLSGMARWIRSNH